MKILLILTILAVLGVTCFLVDRSHRRQLLRRMASRPPMNDDQFGRLFPATQAAAAIRLRHILRNWVDIDLGRMAPTDEFCKHIGLGRLDGMDVDDFIKDVEKDFGITIPLTKAKTMKTFQEMVDCVVAIGNKSNPGEPAGPAYGPPTAARS